MSKHNQPKVRNWIAVSSTFRTSAGAMGGSKRSKNRKDRQSARQELRKEYS